MKMAESDGQGIGDVRWFWWFWQFEFMTDGHLHLSFTGVTIAGQDLFDLYLGVLHLALVAALGAGGIERAARRADFTGRVEAVEAQLAQPLLDPFR